jgi:hypothetical protein
MKKTKIAYWIFTILFSLMMLFSAIPDVLSADVAVKSMHDDLGYPLYIIPFVGIAKVLGVVAILVKGYPKIKEWAYAGLFFDLVGATYSIIAIGTPLSSTVVMLLPLALGVLSYVFYSKTQMLTNVSI